MYRSIEIYSRGKHQENATLKQTLLYMTTRCLYLVYCICCSVYFCYIDFLLTCNLFFWTYEHWIESSVGVFELVSTNLVHCIILLQDWTSTSWNNTGTIHFCVDNNGAGNNTGFNNEKNWDVRARAWASAKETKATCHCHFNGIWSR